MLLLLALLLAPMPSWAVGWSGVGNLEQSQWDGHTLAAQCAGGFREKRVPSDVLWLDIHYLEGFAPFIWDRSRFPDPAKLTSDLRAQGFRLITIVDPHPKKRVGSLPKDPLKSKARLAAELGVGLALRGRVPSC